MGYNKKTDRLERKMSEITLDTLVVGTYTVRELLAAERLWTPDRPPSTPEQIVERHSVARKALHDRIGYVDPKGYYHLKGKQVESGVIETKAEKPEKPVKAKNVATTAVLTGSTRTRTTRSPRAESSSVRSTKDGPTPPPTVAPA